MNAADLPESTDYTGSTAMARRLVTYLDDPVKIRRAVLLEYDTAPGVFTIETMRREYLRQRRKVRLMWQPTAADAHRPREVDEAAFLVNKAFVERLRSAHPERFVNEQWDHEVETAKREADAREGP